MDNIDLTQILFMCFLFFCSYVSDIPILLGYSSLSCSHLSLLWCHGYIDRKVMLFFTKYMLQLRMFSLIAVFMLSYRMNGAIFKSYIKPIFLY